MNVGERIKKRRKELGLSVDEVAERLGKNRATIYRYESSAIEKLPSPVLEPLAVVLSTTPGYLMGWEDEEKEQKETAPAEEGKSGLSKILNVFSSDEVDELSSLSRDEANEVLNLIRNSPHKK